mgnify:CR=1 FL=1
MKHRYLLRQLPAAAAWLLVVIGMPAASGDPTGTSYSPLDQVDSQNAWRLQRAWTWQDRDAAKPADTTRLTGLPATPILLPDAAGGGLVFCTSTSRMVSVDPVTGAERWRHDPKESRTRAAAPLECRGVAYWHDSAAAGDQQCAHRIFSSAGGRRLIAVDAATGLPCGSFGEGGQVEVQSSAAPVIVNGVLVVGGRGFDARTGQPRWQVDAISGDSGPSSVDGKRDLVFVPHAGAVTAVRGATGEMAWSFTTVERDEWNWGAPAQPILVDITKDRRSIPAAIVPTRQSLVFVLDRATGKPIFPVEARRVSDVDGTGGTPSAAQPFPLAPPPLLDTTLGPGDAWGLTFWDQKRCQQQIENARHIGLYPPAGDTASIIYPGPAAGPGRASGAWDPTRNLFVMGLAQTGVLVERLAKGETVSRPLTGASGLPCTSPPWAKLVAVDIAAGGIRWSVPLGTTDRLASLPVPPLKWGNTIVAGGPLVTAGGIVVIGATGDSRLRAFAADTGADVWTTVLPAPAYASPMTYERDGRQFIVIAAGYAGEFLVAHALPDNYVQSADKPD